MGQIRATAAVQSPQLGLRFGQQELTLCGNSHLLPGKGRE